MRGVDKCVFADFGVQAEYCFVRVHDGRCGTPGVSWELSCVVGGGRGGGAG